jgi:hypothetical protein
MNLRDIRRWHPTQYVLHFAWVYRNSSNRDDMPKESNLRYPKFTLTEFGIQLIRCEFLEHQSQMFFLFFFRLRVYQDIIDEDHNELVQILHKYLIHEIHEIDRGIHKSKGHYSILLKSISGAEHCLGNI